MLQLHSLHAYCQQKLLQVYNFRGKRLSLSLSLNLSYYLSCILFLFGSLLLCILCCCCFLCYLLSSFHCMLRTVTTSALSPYIGFQFTLPTTGGNKSFQYSALYSALCFLRICFQLFSVFYLALQQLRLVAFGLSTVLLRSGQIVYLPFIFIVPVIQIVYTVYIVYIYL